MHFKANMLYFQKGITRSFEGIEKRKKKQEKYQWSTSMNRI